MKLALFKYNLEATYTVVKTEEEASITVAARVSEWVEVDFPMRDLASAVSEQIMRMNAEIERKRVEQQIDIAKLEAHRDRIARSELADLNVC
jgi:hypothetical protein